MAANREHPIEVRRQTVQAELDAAKSAAERNRLGQFATPNALAVDIANFLDSVIGGKVKKVHFADPSIGTGSFFSAALSVFGARRISSAVGIEIDSGFCSAARELWQDAGLEVVEGDFSRLVANGSCPEAPNLILANPPYVRHHHIGREEKERLQRLVLRLTGVEVNGLAGLYVYFFLLASFWMQDDGYAAWLIPSEFMDVNYGAALKKFLVEKITLIRVHRFDPDDVQFDDALVSSAVVVFKKSPPPPDHQPVFSFGGSLENPERSEEVSLDELRETRKWTRLPKSDEEGLFQSSREDNPTLSDLFIVQRGIATGSNKFFIMERTEAERRGLPSQFLRPILPSPRYLKETVIEADKKGYPAIDKQLCVLDCDLPEGIVESRHPSLWKYLLTAEKIGVMEGYLVNKRSPWYKQEHREPAPFLCTYMGRGSDDKRPFRFILNRSRAIGTNLYLMLYPRDRLARMLDRRPGLGKEVYDLLCQITGNELRKAGRVYGGGLNKIEPRELGRVDASLLLARWPELADGVWRPTNLRLF